MTLSASPSTTPKQVLEIFVVRQFLPLTLTLSLREREHRGPVLEKSDGFRFADRLAMVLPLPNPA
jgi:hypothetical protein